MKLTLSEALRSIVFNRHVLAGAVGLVFAGLLTVCGATMAQQAGSADMPTPNAGDAVAIAPSKSASSGEADAAPKSGDADASKKASDRSSGKAPAKTSEKSSGKSSAKASTADDSASDADVASEAGAGDGLEDVEVVKEEPVEEVVEEVSLDGALGDKGRLIIPDVGVGVALYDGPADDAALSQAICDAEDSAVVIGWTPVPFIGDHNTQGFEAIKSCVPGQTRAYVQTCDGNVLQFLCTDAFIGTNYGNAYVENEQAIAASGACDLVMYTCNESQTSITLVTWVEEGSSLSARYLLSQDGQDAAVADSAAAAIPVPDGSVVYQPQYDGQVVVEESVVVEQTVEYVSDVQEPAATVQDQQIGYGEQPAPDWPGLEPEGPAGPPADSGTAPADHPGAGAPPAMP